MNFMVRIVKQLKQFKTDAIYEKKKHYNAAERKRRYYKILSFTQIFLNAITGTTLLTLVFGKGSKVAEIIALILTIIATILASIQKIGDYEKQAQGNAKVADMLRRSGKPVILVVNKVDNFDKYMADTYEFYNLGIGDPVPISASSRLGLEMGSQFPTNQRDYNKAKNGIQNGEENYTIEELDLWE